MGHFVPVVSVVDLLLTRGSPAATHGMLAFLGAASGAAAVIPIVGAARRPWGVAREVPSFRLLPALGVTLVARGCLLRSPHAPSASVFEHCRRPRCSRYLPLLVIEAVPEGRLLFGA